MANKVQEQTDVMVEAKGKLELFFDKCGNKILWVLVAVAIVVGAYFIYKNYAASKHEAMSLEASAALNAAETIEDYAAIATKYEGTEAANTALYSAGALALDAGDLAAAKSYLAKYQNAEGPAGEILNALVYGLRGDIATKTINQGVENLACGALSVLILCEVALSCCEVAGVESQGTCRVESRISSLGTLILGSDSGVVLDSLGSVQCCACLQAHSLVLACSIVLVDEVGTYNDCYCNQNPQNLVTTFVEEQLQLTLSLNHYIGLLLYFVCHNSICFNFLFFSNLTCYE